MQINISPSACAYIKKMIGRENGIGMRLSVTKTGCSGYAYAPKIIDQVNPLDTLCEIEDIRIYLDTDYFSLLQNVSIDYFEENKAGLQQKRLVFTNPNEAGRCGCGESFHLNEV